MMTFNIRRRAAGKVIQRRVARMFKGRPWPSHVQLTDGRVYGLVAGSYELVGKII